MREVKETAYCLDEVDQKILELLEKDARMSLKDIAECVFLSSTAVSTRIERLKEAGVIEGFQVQINPIALGYYTKAFINLEVETNDKQDFYPFINKGTSHHLLKRLAFSTSVEHRNIYWKEENQEPNA